MRVLIRVLGRLAILAALVFAGGAALTAVSVVGSTVASAQVINAIVVQGNRRVDVEAIRGYIQIKPGDRADPSKIDDALKALYNTGLFEDVKINVSGGRLIVTVIENAVIDRVIFEGNKKVKDETLNSEIQSKSRGPLNRNAVQADVQRIIEVYRRSGRYDVRVEPKIIERKTGRVDLVFEINEGEKTAIKKIVFVGNKAYSDWKLKDVLSTTEKTWLSWIKNTDVYDPDRVSADQEALRRFYLKNGYADFRIVSANVDLNRTDGGFIITFTLDEGEQYRTGSVEVISNMRDVDPEVLKGLVRTKTGDVYSADLVEKSIEDLTIDLAKRGYAFATVRPRGDRDFATRRINLVYVVEQGTRAYIERINIRGNTRTRDYVIRREFDIYEGDAYNRALVDRAERRLKNLGYFKNVKITNEPGSAPDRIILNVDVEDQLTGDFSVAGGYSTAAGFLAEVSVGERNFLGSGNSVRASVSYGQYQRGANFSYTDPYMLGYRVAGGFDIFANQTLPNSYQTYQVNTVGGSLRTGMPLNDDTSLGLRYSLFQRTLTAPSGLVDNCRVLNGGYIYPNGPLPPTDPGYGAQINCSGVSNDGTIAPPLGYPGGKGLAQGFYDPNEISPAFKQALGKTVTSQAGYTIAYNTLDSNKDPTSGLLITLGQDFAGLGGDTAYLRTAGEARYYRPLGGDFVGMLKGTAGYVAPYGGQTLRILDGFFKGPELVRGFQPSGIGPRDLGSQSQDSLGGQQFWGTTAELQFPLSFLPKDLGLRAAVFADAGSLWGYHGVTNINGINAPYYTSGPYQCPSGTTGPKGTLAAPVDVCVADSSSIRSSTGVSLIWTSPFGPIRFDFAKALTKEPYDKTQFFRFSGGSAF
jgi:outer membrane protein insertion porin family